MRPMRDHEIPSAGLPFMKMHGLGNDFVVIDARRGDASSRVAYQPNATAQAAATPVAAS